MSNQGSISAVCNLPSKYVTVKGSKMHYLEAGKGDPVLFIHGMPTSSYLWRNIIPYLSDNSRCIAVDLIGMGNSDKPDIEYRVFDHIEYINAFIEQLKLKNLTLVLHGWGSVIGFDYAKRNELNVKGLVFYEAHLYPEINWQQLSLPIQQLSTLLNRPGASYRAIIQQNYFLKKLLQNATMRRLSQEELANYERPFATPESRKPLWQYIQEVPLGNRSQKDVINLIENYSLWLQQTAIPKLMFYAIPGFMTTLETVQWAKKNLKNLSLAELENMLHFAQESCPEIFGHELREWYLNLSVKKVKNKRAKT